MFEEDDNASKRLKLSQYHSFLGNSLNNNINSSGMSSSTPNDLQFGQQLPLLHPQSQSVGNVRDPQQTPSQSLPFPVYHYNGGYYGQSPNPDNGLLPFNNFLPTPQHTMGSSSSYSSPSAQSHMVHSVQPSQVYYFSSPPFMHQTQPSLRQQTSNTMQQPYSMNTITTLQHPHNHIESPLTQMLHSVPLGNESYEQSLPQSYKFSTPNANTSATLTNTRPITNSNVNTLGTIDKAKKKKIETLKKKEGLEESSIRIINLLQEKGKMVFRDIHETLGIDYRRAYDILNILLTTSLVTKTGKKRENKLPFIYQDGIPMQETVELRDILGEIAREEEKNRIAEQRIALLEAALASNEPTDRVLAQLKEVDGNVAADPFFRELFKKEIVT